MRWLAFLCLIASAGSAASQADLAPSQADLITCTANLRVTYAPPLTARQVTGAVFRDAALGPETLAACAAYAADAHNAPDGDGMRDPRAVLWHAYALTAAERRVEALGVLLTIESGGNAAAPWADPHQRALALRAALQGGVEGADHPLFAAEVTPAVRLRLMRAGLLSVARGVAAFEREGAYRPLMAVYSGSQDLAVDGQALGPDLAKLRALADAAVGQAVTRNDPLAAIRALKTASGYYQRAQEAAQEVTQQDATQDITGVAAQPAQARWRLEQALGLGLRGWHQLERDAGYRADLVRETLPLVSTLLETSDTADVLHSIAEAVATDWAGLRTGQGLNPAAAFQAAADAGSAAARARLALTALAQGQAAATDVAATLVQLSQRDSCVFDPLATAHRVGLFSGAPDAALAQAIYTRGQRAGDAGSFFGEGEMRRFGRGGQGEGYGEDQGEDKGENQYDFAGAKTLFTQALSQLNLTRCSRAIPARTHLLLGWFEHTGQGGQMDLAAAHTHFRSATQWGSYYAAEALAEQYFFGLGVPQDPVLAFDYATKAYEGNPQAHPTLLAFDFYGQSGGALAGIGAGGLELPPRTQAAATLAEAMQAGQFSATLLLGLGMSADAAIQGEMQDALQDAVRSAVSESLSADQILAGLESHIGAFERAYQGGRADDWADMNAALAGQINLAFTAARYDTVAAISPDPARALAFYTALPADHPVAQKMLRLDRFPYLSVAAQQRVGQGPIELQGVVDQGLANELAPLALTILLSP